MKSKGLAVLFGLIPGAGQMYLGKMKRGLTLMLLFWGTLAVAVFLETAVPIFIMPVVWFYAFFDALNLSALRPEQLELEPDIFLFGLLDNTNLRDVRFLQKKNALLGWGFIVLGGILLYNSLSRMLFQFLSDILANSNINTHWLWSIYNWVPQIFLGVLIIVLGIRFMKGSKAVRDDIKPYGGQA